MDETFTDIDGYVRRWMAYRGMPGLALGITDRGRTLKVAAYGFSDLAARSPVTPEMLFQIGSISKSFTSIVLLQLMEEGKLDVHDPVVKYVPWFDVRPNPDAITLHHLMTHTSGMIMGSDETISARSEVWSLRDTELSAPPGTHYHYSNSGYKLLGLVVEEITGRPFNEVLRERVLLPVGMKDSEPAITDSIRLRTVTGHVGLHSDRPHSRSGPFAPVTWFESDTADGSISSTPGDMATYVRMLLNRGQIAGGRVVGEESFELMTRPHVSPSNHRHGDHYGYGLVIEELDGRNVIGHEGGMVGQFSSMLLDPTVGIGVIVMVNGLGDPKDVARFALAAARAAVEGNVAPATLPPDGPAHVEDASEYAGRYSCSSGSLLIEARGDRLVLRNADSEVELEVREDGMFFADVPGMDRFLIRFERENGRVAELFHGEDWYVNERYTGPRAHKHPRAWEGLVGHYISYNPWLQGFRVVLRKDSLVYVPSNGREEEMTPLPDGTFRVGADPLCPERLRFDMLVDGAALRANLSGGRFYRSFVP